MTEQALKPKWCQNQEYYQQHREVILARSKTISSKEKRRVYWTKYKEQNLERIKKLARDGAKKRRKLIRLKIFSLLGNKCIHCGFADIRALQIDHIHACGSGNAKKNWRQRQTTFYFKILKEIKVGSKDYQLLCANCNWIKRHENNEG